MNISNISGQEVEQQPRPGTTAHSFHEASQLVNGLVDTIQLLGGAYTELSGQAAAAQAVVFDLRQCLVYLRSRSGREPVAAPWINPPAPSNHSPDCAVTPPPQTTNLTTQTQVPAVSTPHNQRSSPNPPSTRGPPTLPTHRGVSPKTPGVPATSKNTPKLPRSSSMQQQQQQQPAREAAATATPRGTARSASTGRTSARAGVPPASRGSPSSTKPPSSPPLTGNSSKATASPHTFTLSTPPPTRPGVVDPLQPLNLPQAYDWPSDSTRQSNSTGGRVMNTVSSRTMGQTLDNQISSARRVDSQQDDVMSGPGPPPQLPNSYLKACHQFKTVLRECVGTQRSTAFEHGVDVSYHQALVDAGREFTRSLYGLWPHDESNISKDTTTLVCHGPSGTGGLGISALKHEAQVAYAALVSAQTWLLQALSDAATSPHNSTSLLHQVQPFLRDLNSLEDEYRACCSKVQAAEAAVLKQRHGAMNESNAAKVATLEKHQDATCGQMTAERVPAAARWRNRFLRAMLSTSPRASKSAMGDEHIHGQAQPPQPPLQMPRPLGCWLPIECWQPSLRDGIPIPSGCPPFSDGHGLYVGNNIVTAQTVATLAPWLLAMPADVLEAAQKTLIHVHDLHAVPAAGCRLPSTSQTARAHTKAIMQLQQHLFRLCFEKRAGKAVSVTDLPGRAAVLAKWMIDSKLKHSFEMQGEPNETDIERLLATLRLAQLLLTKDAWGQVHCIVE